MGDDIDAKIMILARQSEAGIWSRLRSITQPKSLSGSLRRFNRSDDRPQDLQENNVFFRRKKFGARERWSGFPFNIQQPNQIEKPVSHSMRLRFRLGRNRHSIFRSVNYPPYLRIHSGSEPHDDHVHWKRDDRCRLNRNFRFENLASTLLLGIHQRDTRSPKLVKRTIF